VIRTSMAFAPSLGVRTSRTAFVATAKQHAAFLALIDAPLAKNEGVKRLLARRAPWEK